MLFIATIGGLITLLFWGLGDYFTGKSGQKGNPALTNLIVQLAGFLPFSIVVLFQGFSIPSISTIALVAFIGAMFTVAFILFIKALAIGPFGIAAPLSNSYALITLIVGMLFLHFTVSVPKLLVLLLIIVGVVMLAIERSTFNRASFRGGVIYFAGSTALLWGVGFALATLALKEMEWYEFLFLLNAFTAVYAFICYRALNGRLPKWGDVRYKNASYAWSAGILLTIGSSALFASSQYSGGIVIPAIISSAAPLVTSFLAYYHDNERLSLYKRLGAVVIIVGLMVLNVV